MFLDIGVGILLSILMHFLFAVEVNPAFLFFGIALTLFPDIDFCIEYIKHGSVGGKFIREHRELLHFPLAYVPVIGIIFFVWGNMWATFAGLAFFSHFLHDSIGIGWGIKWLWPFSKKSYKFFSDKNGKFSSQILVSWNPSELQQTVTAHGDLHWIRNIYFKPSKTNILELFVFVVSLLTLYFFLQ